MTNTFRPTEQKLLDIIEAAGRITYLDLAEKSGIKRTLVAERLKRAISFGIIHTEQVPSGRGRPGLEFIWVGQAASAPHSPAQRKCLACGRDFRSQSAANRICPSCATANARASSGGRFDEPSIIRYR